MKVNITIRGRKIHLGYIALFLGVLCLGTSIWIINYNLRAKAERQVQHFCEVLTSNDLPQMEHFVSPEVQGYTAFLDWVRTPGKIRSCRVLEHSRPENKPGLLDCQTWRKTTDIQTDGKLLPNNDRGFDRGPDVVYLIYSCERVLPFVNLEYWALKEVQLRQIGIPTSSSYCNT